MLIDLSKVSPFVQHAKKQHTMTYTNTNMVKDPGLLARIQKVSEKNGDPRSKDFIASLLEFAKKNEGLTKNQLSCFERLESHFSPQAEERAKEWTATYDQTKRDLVIMCAEYYRHTPYSFDGIIKRILEEPDFIPTEEQFKKITANKYAQKVMTSTTAIAKYPKNSLVQIRKEAKGLPAPMLGRLAFVVQANSSPVRNAAKGAKRYKILPFGTTQTIEVEERHLKWGKTMKDKPKGDKVGES